MALTIDEQKFLQNIGLAKCYKRKYWRTTIQINATGKEIATINENATGTTSF